ncbi:MAG: M15 family metallopeptidase [Saprospiraceae bacterium]|nr:M15 family metallopeptidase [Saprospiraceae bacterium]
MIPIKYLCCFLSFLLVILSCKAQKSGSNAQDIIDSKPELSDDKEIDQTFDIDYLMGKFDPAEHTNFTTIPPQYRDEEVRYIRKDVLRAFINMFNSAAKEGIHFKIKSATRNFENQKRIWENKWTGRTILEDNVNAAKDIQTDIDRAKKILSYSSMPGTSRHHWGTDMDLNNFTNEWFTHGEGLIMYDWLKKNADDFGFCQPYTKLGTDRNTGYFEEKWHWTFMPVSSELMLLAKSKLTNEMISGFLGSETAKEIDIVNNYMLGISPSCMLPD